VQSQAAVFLWTALQRTHSTFTPYSPLALITDFLLNICAILFAFTLYSATPLVLNLSLITPAAALLLLTLSKDQESLSLNVSSKVLKKKPARAGQHVSSEKDVELAPVILPVRPFVTHYRGTMMVATCLAILAVDFPVFPRRYAKVETWGTSLMDLGVGSFVFSAGVVSARAIVRDTASFNGNINPAEQGASISKQKHAPSAVTRLRNAFQHSIPLLVLGLVRLYSIKGLDYAEHVTEYGVHWNFFFTLALLPPFAELSDTLTRRIFKSYAVLAMLLVTLYELVLNNTSLLAYILISPRGPSLLSKNREGVFSFIGYLAIFLAGRDAGIPLMKFNLDKVDTEPNPKHRKILSRATPEQVTSRERTYVLFRLIGSSSLYIVLYLVATSLYTFNLTVSRRLANLPYMLWTVAFNTAQLALFGLIESCGPDFSYEGAALDGKLDAADKRRIAQATSRVLRVFNSNGLVVFLVANLLTGLVNLTVNTLDMAGLKAMGVLVVYAVLVTGVAMGLDLSGVKIRL
jgi:glucosaminylphosphatidylinositol acyltransferase